MTFVLNTRWRSLVAGALALIDSGGRRGGRVDVPGAAKRETKRSLPSVVGNASMTLTFVARRRNPGPA